MNFEHVGMKPLPELVEETKETGRTYLTPAGKKYPSITTVLKVLSQDGIDEWKKRVGEDEARKVLVQAGRRGTAFHEVAEKYLNNDPTWKQTMPVNLHSFLQLKPILDSRVNRIWAQEAPLYSDVFRIAGRVDLIAEWDGELAIIDFKTARKPKKKEWIQNYFLQVSFYAAAFYEATNNPIRKGVILVTPDGSEPQIFETGTHDNLAALMNIRKKYREIHGV